MVHLPVRSGKHRNLKWIESFFPNIKENLNFNFIKCENCGGLWFCINKERMIRLWDLKMKESKMNTDMSMNVCIVGGGKYHITEWEAAGNIMVGTWWVGRQ
jgi:hypothetical protein